MSSSVFKLSTALDHPLVLNGRGRAYRGKLLRADDHYDHPGTAFFLANFDEPVDLDQQYTVNFGQLPLPVTLGKGFALPDGKYQLDISIKAPPEFFAV